jgi:arylamine N-acetyltransferase
MYPPLNSNLTGQVLSMLGCAPTKPGVRQVNQLIRAYVRNVPWESASRIAKRARTAELERRPRWPAEFWNDTINHGCGGTCFESNYAFLSLLVSLGYWGYLTVNNMGETVGCHSAIIIEVEGSRYLVDVGIPIHTMLLLRTDAPTRRPSQFHTYIVRTDGTGQYQVERTNHPRRNIYTLIDRPINESDYRAITTQDYGPLGLFLDRVVITKVIDEQVWRFNSGEKPYQLEAFAGKEKRVVPLSANMASELADHFGMSPHIVSAALDAVETVAQVGAPTPSTDDN